MTRKLFAICSLIMLIISLAACGGLRFSQVSPEAKDFHPQRIAVFPVEIGGNSEEAKGAVEKIVAGVLADKKWFSNITDAESLNRELPANEELRKTMADYLSKLRTVNFSDPELSKKIGEITNTDAFLMVSVDIWSYTMEKEDKVAKVSLGMKLYEAATGKLMWKAGHQIAKSYILIKPDLPDVARDVVEKMVVYMPH
ncbi:MAG: hypothetical protein HGB33_05915 [Syntrophaceae bacterium]|nr:hypothetical protein [Syntrophaceae bacterium]